MSAHVTGAKLKKFTFCRCLGQFRWSADVCSHDSSCCYWVMGAEISWLTTEPCEDLGENLILGSTSDGPRLQLQMMSPDQHAIYFVFPGHGSHLSNGQWLDTAQLHIWWRQNFSLDTNRKCCNWPEVLQQLCCHHSSVLWPHTNRPNTGTIWNHRTGQTGQFSCQTGLNCVSRTGCLGFLKAPWLEISYFIWGNDTLHI